MQPTSPDPLNDQFNIAGSQTQLEVVCDDEAEQIEVEVSEDDIEYLIQDESGREIGFAVREGDEVVEYFYAEDDESPSLADELNLKTEDDSAAPETTSATKEVLGKLGALAGKGAKSAGNAAVNAAHGAAELAKEATSAGKQGGIAAGAGVIGHAALDKGKEIKDALPDAARSVKDNANPDAISETLGITKEDMQAVGKEIGEIAKEGAELAGEFKGLLDDLNDTFNFSEYSKLFKKSGIRRR